MATDIDILTKAFEKEKGKQYPRFGLDHSWEYYAVGASREDMRRLVDEGLITIAHKDSIRTKYLLTDKGRELVWPTNMEIEMTNISADEIMEAMSLIIGFDDIKDAVAGAIADRQKLNFLLEGPPACAKSLILEGVRSVAPRAYMAFGSRTSGAGLSDKLFEEKPEILLMDEADKMRHDVFSLLLGLMESGEIIETKSQKTRGVKLKTMVIGACNSSAKMPPEFLSRFVHFKFPPYTRDEFITVVIGFLSRVENSPEAIAQAIGERVWDEELGDVRRARSAFHLLKAPTLQEVDRVLKLMKKYSPDQDLRQKPLKIGHARLPGM